MSVSFGNIIFHLLGSGAGGGTLSYRLDFLFVAADVDDDVPAF